MQVPRLQSVATILGIAVLFGGDEATACEPEAPLCCDSSSDPRALTAGGVPLVQHIDISAFLFLPAQVTVPVGTTTRWINNDPSDHTVTATATPSPFDSGLMAPQAVFDHQFLQVGEFPYVCAIHFGMDGSVTVRAAGDATGNNTVDIDDFGVLAGNFNEPGGFSDGDFDLSGIVDIDDFGLLATNFNLSFGGLAGRGATVPEPASAFLVACAALSRRGHRRG